MSETTNDKPMRLRYAGQCRLCGSELPARAEAVYERSTKTVRCVVCVLPSVRGNETSREVPPPLLVELDPGIPGASARREFERRKTARESRVRDRHPKLGGLLLALSDDPQSTRSWAIGAVGEERVGRELNDLASPRLRVLHDRRIPGRRSNIDHLVVTTAGVFVVDPKRYTGRPELRVEGGLLRPRIEKLMVNGRDRTKLVDGMLGQLELVRALVGDEVPVRGILCFVDADWPLIGGSFTTRDVAVLWPRRLLKMLSVDGDLPLQQVADLHRQLAESLPPA